MSIIMLMLKDRWYQQHLPFWKKVRIVAEPENKPEVRVILFFFNLSCSCFLFCFHYVTRKKMRYL